MSTSVIKRINHPIQATEGSGTSNTGKSTFANLMGYRSAIFVANDCIGTIKLTSNGTASTTYFSNPNVQVENGTNSFTVTGLDWWDYPYIIAH